MAYLPYYGDFQMLRMQTGRLESFSAIKIMGLSAALLIQTACGGGDDKSEAVALNLQDVAIAFIKRPTPRDQNGDIASNDMRDPTNFTEGGDLYVQKSATSSAKAVNVTNQLTSGRGDVKDVNVSYDGTKLIFSLRLEDLSGGQNTPRWYIYEYDITNDSITQLTFAGSDDGDDVSPNYLSDGRIIFSSNRQTISKTIRSNELRGSFIALNEDRRNSAFALHVLETNGSYTQVSFNRSNDLDPIILKDSGRVLFSRWNNMGTNDQVSLYSMNPDGSDVRLYYGAHSHNTGQAANTAAYSKPREMEDGRIMAILRPFVTNFGGGDVVFIDGKNFADNTQPIWSKQGSISGTAQTTFKQNISAANGLALAGRYNAVFPMVDGSNRYLMSWSECKIMDTRLNPPLPVACNLAKELLNDPNVVEAPPSYGIYLVNNSTQALLVKPEDDKIISSIVMVYPRKAPSVPTSSANFNAAFAADSIGVLHIRSVYDFDNNFPTSPYGVALPVKTQNNDVPAADIVIDSVAKIANPVNTKADNRPARFIRIIKGVSNPDPINVANESLDDTAFGNSRQRNLGMQEIIGYAPIEPDGSVKIKVPANVPLTISVLDKDGRRISSRDGNGRIITNRHQSWFQVNPGETLECIGCHVHNTRNQPANKPHGRAYLQTDYTARINQGAATTGVGFPYSLNSLTAEIYETMAETRARKNDCSPNMPPCDVMKPSVDLIYDDVWTDEFAANRSADTSFSIDYSTAPVSPATSGACTNAAADSYNKSTYGTNSYTYCRVTINYEQHIEPIWTATLNRPNGSCVSCHNQASNNAYLLDAGRAGDNPLAYQLNLVSNTAADDPFFNSYVELTARTPKFINNAGTIETQQTQQIINGVPQFLLLADGSPDLANPILVDVTVLGPVDSSGAFSSYFTEKLTNIELNSNRGLNGFTQAQRLDHSGYLTPSELKLISEWIDLGAQYFNNPFHPDAPTN